MNSISQDLYRGNMYSTSAYLIRKGLNDIFDKSE